MECRAAQLAEARRLSHRERNPAGALAGAVVALAAAMGLGRFAYTQLLPPMVEQLHLSALAAAWIAAANFIGYLAGALVAAYLCARFNERRVALLGLLTLALTLALTASNGALAWLVLTRFAAGIESAVIFVSVGILLFETLEQGLAMIAFGGIGIGIFFGAGLLAPIVAHGPWERGWYAIALASLAATAIAWRLIPPIASRAASGISITGGLPLRLVDASYFLQGVGYVVFATFAVLYLVERGESRAAASGAWLAVGAGATIGPWLSGVFARRMGARLGLIFFQVLEALATVVFALGPLPLPILAAFLFGACFPTSGPLSTVMYIDLDPRDGARGLGWLTFIFAIGQIVGPLIAGPIAQHLGDFRVPLLLSAGALALAALLIALVPHSAGRPPIRYETSSP
ncbi:YbfB/YjiJ family MFS transporter [bacterium]|nr:MAG: YbfB/YjiJ family MFS transporter [bacterium]